jgi:hypothetical protein
MDREGGKNKNGKFKQSEMANSLISFHFNLSMGIE